MAKFTEVFGEGVKAVGVVGREGHRRAEELIRKGHDIRILTEDDFWYLKETEG